MDAEFFYDISSPYAYLAAERIEELLPGARWTPIAFGWLLRVVDRVPWSLRPGPERDAGMAEIERRARERGLPPLRWPPGWPRESYSLNPPRAALVAAEHGRVREFTLAAFRAQFAQGRVLREPAELAEVAQAAGVDPASVREGVDRREIKDRLRANTDHAHARGVTGIPTVALGDRLFWGDDRLEDAAAAARAAQA